MGEHRVKWRNKTLIDLDYADNLSILDENVGKMNTILKILQVHGARIGLKINLEKNKSLRLGISESEEVVSGNKKIDQVDRLNYLCSIISKDGGCNEDVKSRTAKAHGVFSQLKTV
jgi:hypothetical protein